MVDGHRILHAYFVNRENAEFKTPWGQIRSNIPRVFTQDDRAVQLEVVVLLPCIGHPLRDRLRASSDNALMSKGFSAPTPSVAKRSIRAVSDGTVGQNRGRKFRTLKNSRELLCGLRREWVDEVDR